MDRDRYRRGAHTVTDLKDHLVWKTQYSHPVLRGEIGLRLRQILREVGLEREITMVQGNIRPHPIHLLVSAPTYWSPAKRAPYLQGRSSYRLQREFRELQKRYGGPHWWGRGYFWVTVGAVTEEPVKRYIEPHEDESGAFPVWDEPPAPVDATEGGFIRKMVTDFSLKGRSRPSQPTGFSRLVIESVNFPLYNTRHFAEMLHDHFHWNRARIYCSNFYQVSDLKDKIGFPPDTS